MVTLRTRHFAAIAFLAVFTLGVGLSVAFNTNFGDLEVKTILIVDGDQRISGLLYKPLHATSEKPVPGVVLVHGISGSKQFMSDIALELSRQGYVALTIDAVGHGNSEGRLGEAKDSSLGVLAAVRFLESRPFVNASSLGLVGHSLGASAARAAAWAHGNITVSVFIGGGFGSMVADSQYGVLNSTFPRNLLIVIGRYDILFDLRALEEETLPPVFGASEAVEPGIVYGDFSVQTARKLVTPATTHLFEPVDSVVVSETVSWMTNAFELGKVHSNQSTENSLTFGYRNAAVGISLFSFVGLVLVASLVISDFSAFRLPEDVSKAKYGILGTWKALVVWGGLNVGLYVPLSFVGFLIPFPPLIFGAGIAWWALTVGLIALLLASKFLPKISSVNIKLRTALRESFDLRGLNLAIVLYVLAYVIVGLLEIAFAVNMGIVVPFFKALVLPWRLLMFMLFVPFFLVYFFAEGLYLHEFQRWHALKTGFWSEAIALVKTVGVKVIPYVAVLGLQYVPVVLFEVQLLPTFVGFLVEFFWLITVLFVISTACSWWFYRNTSTVGVGAVFNTLLFAWVSASMFPF